MHDCMTLVYPAGEGITFDADYYRDRHLATIRRLFPASIARAELRTALPAAAGAPPSAYAAAVNIWIADRAAFDADNAKHIGTLIEDVPNFTNAEPAIQFEKIRGEMGAPHNSPTIGAACLTVLYKNGEGVRLDAEYYVAHHMPLVMELCGTRAISRFEFRMGDAGAVPGSAASFIGAANMYIADLAAFGAAGAKHLPTLNEDVKRCSSVMPETFLSTVYGCI